MVAPSIVAGTSSRKQGAAIVRGMLLGALTPVGGAPLEMKSNPLAAAGK